MGPQFDFVRMLVCVCPEFLNLFNFPATKPILMRSSAIGRTGKYLGRTFLFSKKFFFAEKKMEQKRSKKFLFDFLNKCGMDG